MKTVHTMGAQGDCLFRRIAELPGGMRLHPPSDRIIVAHSETGHHHSIDDTHGVRFFSDPRNPLVCYLVMEGVEYADVVHHRPFDTHETLRLLAAPDKKTVFEVRGQREFVDRRTRDVTDAWMRVCD